MEQSLNRALVDIPLGYTLCCVCGCLFCYPENFATDAQAQRRKIYCPNGHWQRINLPEATEDEKAGEVERLRQAFDAMQQRHRDNAEGFKRTEAALLERIENMEKEHGEQDARLIAARVRHEKKLRAEIKRLKRAAAGGRCPLCKVKTNFQAEHMEAMHPRFYQLFTAADK